METITLRNIKLNVKMSEETPCFSATIYVDGTVAGDVCNRGYGGPNDYHFTTTATREATMDAAVAEAGLADYVKTDTDALDNVVAARLDAWEAEKQYRRWCKKQTVFRLPTDPAGEWRTIKSPWGPGPRKYATDKYGPDVIFLNEKFS